MKRVLIYAYTKVNLGDDLFVHTLCNRYPNIKFNIIVLKNECNSLKNIKNLRCIKLDNIIIRIINVFFRKINFSDNIIEHYIKKIVS